MLKKDRDRFFPARPSKHSQFIISSVYLSWLHDHTRTLITLKMSVDDWTCVMCIAARGVGRWGYALPYHVFGRYSSDWLIFPETGNRLRRSPHSGFLTANLLHWCIARRAGYLACTWDQKCIDIIVANTRGKRPCCRPRSKCSMI